MVWLVEEEGVHGVRRRLALIDSGVLVEDRALSLLSVIRVVRREIKEHVVKGMGRLTWISLAL